MGENARSLGWGLLAGFLAGLPALLRGWGSDDSPQLLALVGVCALPALLVAPVVLGLRRARAARRLLPPDERARSFSTLLGTTLVLSLAPLSWLGAWLEKSTHHRPLGAVTFACAALCVLLAALLVARRLGTLQQTTPQRVVRIGCLVVTGGIGAYLLIQGAVASARTGSTWLDVLSLIGWTAAAIWLPPLERSTPSTSFRAVEQPAEASATETSANARGVAATKPGVAGGARLWRSLVAVWLSLCVVGVLALIRHTAELTALAPAFTWPFR